MGRDKPYTLDDLEKDRAIVQYVEGQGINFKYPEHWVEENVRLLVDVCGYKNLRVGPNSSGEAFLPISQCKPERVNAVAENNYNVATVRLEKLASGQLKLEIPKDMSVTRQETQGELELGISPASEAALYHF